MFSAARYTVCITHVISVYPICSPDRMSVITTPQSSKTHLPAPLVICSAHMRLVSELHNASVGRVWF